MQFCTVLLSAVLPQWLAVATNTEEATMQVLVAKQEIAAIFGMTNVERMCASQAVGQHLLDAGDVTAMSAHMDELINSLLASLSA